MPRDFYASLFDDAYFQLVLKTYEVRVIVYDVEKTCIEQWIK